MKVNCGDIKIEVNGNGLEMTSFEEIAGNVWIVKKFWEGFCYVIWCFNLAKSLLQTSIKRHALESFQAFPNLKA